MIEFAPPADRLTTLISERRRRVVALRAATATLDDEIRVLECFARIRHEWRTLPCRGKIRHVLGHGVAFSPSELAALLDERLNTVRSTLIRMRTRGEAKREGHGKWGSTRTSPGGAR